MVLSPDIPVSDGYHPVAPIHEQPPTPSINDNNDNPGTCINPIQSTPLSNPHRFHIQSALSTPRHTPVLCVIIPNVYGGCAYVQLVPYQSNYVNKLKIKYL